MLKTTCTLVQKKMLTHNVFELTYTCSALLREPPKPGQYVLFQLIPGLARAYSIVHWESEGYTNSSGDTQPTFTLIIKKILGGRGSHMLCNTDIPTDFSIMIPLGNFVLQDTPASKCFIGTGTGFAPLFFQLKASLEKKDISQIAFLFGVRCFEDIFYTDAMYELLQKFPHLSLVHFFSREKEENISQEDFSRIHKYRGYVTAWLTPENIAPYTEFYICGSGAMVQGAREKLKALGIASEQIFWEQY